MITFTTTEKGRVLACYETNERWICATAKETREEAKQALIRLLNETGVNFAID